MHRCILSSITLAVLTAPAIAQDNKAVDLVPDDALGFVMVKDLRRLSDAVEKLAKKLEVEERVSLLELIQKGIGIREGLNENGSALFIVVDDKKKDEPPSTWPMPPWLFAVAVTDYAKVAQQLGVNSPKEGINEGQSGAESGLLAAIGGIDPNDKAAKTPVLFAKRGDFVLLARPKDREALEHVMKSKTSIAASLQPAREWLDQQEISGVCTQHGVRKAGLYMMGAGVESGSPGQFAGLKDTFAEVEKNVKLIAFAGNVEQGGHPRLSTRIYFDPEGSYAKWIAKVQPADGSMLARLPDQPFAVAGLGHISAQANYEGAIRLLMGSLPPDSRDKLIAKVAKLVRRVSEVGCAAYMDSADKKEPTFDGGLLARVDDAHAFVTEAVDLFKQLREATKDKEKSEVTFEEKSLAGRPSWVIRHVEKNEPKDGKTPPFQWPPALVLSELDAQTVLLSTPENADRAEAIVKKFAEVPKRPLTKNAELQKTAATLPDKLQLAVYVNVRPVVTLFGFSDVADCPPVAFAVRALPASLEAQFVVPVETLQAVVKADKGTKKGKGKEK
jgi:hypothetical protein